MIDRPYASRARKLREMERHYRQQGYADGLAGKPARSTEATYQQAWRRGREARADHGA